MCVTDGLLMEGFFSQYIVCGQQYSISPHLDQLFNFSRAPGLLAAASQGQEVTQEVGHKQLFCYGNWCISSMFEVENKPWLCNTDSEFEDSHFNAKSDQGVWNSWMFNASGSISSAVHKTVLNVNFQLSNSTCMCDTLLCFLWTPRTADV